MLGLSQMLLSAKLQFQGEYVGPFRLFRTASVSNNLYILLNFCDFSLLHCAFYLSFGAKSAINNSMVARRLCFKGREVHNNKRVIITCFLAFQAKISCVRMSDMFVCFSSKVFIWQRRFLIQ